MPTRVPGFRTPRRPRRAFAGVRKILVGERFKSDEHAGAAGQGHFPHQRRIIGEIECYRRAPDFFRRPQGAAKLAQIIAPGAEIVVYEHGVRLAVSIQLPANVLRLAHAIRHPQSVGG